MISPEIIAELKIIFGAENVFQDKSVVSKYFRTDASPELVLATPDDAKQIQEAVKFATIRQIPIFTVGGKFCADEIALREGILLDTRKMNMVHEVDPLNLHTCHRSIDWPIRGTALRWTAPDPCGMNGTPGFARFRKAGSP